MSSLNIHNRDRINCYISTRAATLNQTVSFSKDCNYLEQNDFRRQRKFIDGTPDTLFRF